MRATIKGVKQVYDIAIANAEVAVDQYGSECGFDSYYENCMDTLSEEGLLTADAGDYAHKVFARTLQKLASDEQLDREGWAAEPPQVW